MTREEGLRGLKMCNRISSDLIREACCSKGVFGLYNGCEIHRPSRNHKVSRSNKKCADYRFPVPQSGLKIIERNSSLSSDLGPSVFEVPSH